MESIFAGWVADTRGEPIDVDGWYGGQCVDLAMSLAQRYFPGHGWQETLGFGNAKDLFSAANDAFFDKIPYENGTVPQPGDLLVKDGTPSNPEGHIAAVISADSNTAHVLQQNGYNPSGVAYDGDIPLINNHIIGFLRPKGEDMDTINVLQSALNEARSRADVFESALNAERQKNVVLQSALNAERSSDNSEYNLLGRALASLLNTLGYKKG